MLISRRPLTALILDCFSVHPTKRSKVHDNHSETRTTASVLKQDENTCQVKKNGIYSDKTQQANFSGQTAFSSYKTALKQPLNDEQ